MNGISLRDDFFKQISNQPTAMGLFEYIPDTYFFIKDTAGRFITANKMFLEFSGLANEKEILGKTDLELFPRHLAESYLRDDLQIMTTGEPIINRLEISRNTMGEINWYCTTKIPLYNETGAIIGLVGFSRDIKKSNSSFKPFEEMSIVIDYIMANYHEAINLKKLAALSSLSTSQFERRFKKNFQVTPTEYIQNVRVQAACQYLRENEQPIAWIGMKTGHYDHSHFTRYFTKAMGMSPKQYREKNSIVNKKTM